MNVKIPLWVALAACVGCLALGSVRAQQGPAGQADPAQPGKPGAEQPIPSEYPYLPARYGEAFIPSMAEWQAHRLTTFAGIPTRLTDSFRRRNQSCFVMPKGLLLSLDLEPLPAWKGWSDGKFTRPVAEVRPDLEQAVTASMATTRRFFSEVRNENVFIQITIQGDPVGTWDGGKLSLNAEKTVVKP